MEEEKSGRQYKFTNSQEHGLLMFVHVKESTHGESDSRPFMKSGRELT